MKLMTYAGESLSDALEKATKEHGKEALIVSTKEIRKKSITQSGLYEIIVAIEETQEKNSIQKKMEEINKKNIQKSLNTIQQEDANNDVELELSDAVKKISEIARPISQPITPTIAQKNPQKEQSDKKEFKAIKDEMEKLNDKLKLVQNMFWEEKGPKNAEINIPHEFAEIYRIAKNSGMDKNHLDSIMKLSLELMPIQMRQSSTTIKRYFREVLRRMISCRSENLDMGTKKIMMFVGPTGVGKTTTLAKLAARYSLMLEKKYKVGIITLDSYRIAAVEQLMTYARMMKLSIDRVDEPHELNKAIDGLRHCDFILIDTAGHSQHDQQKLDLLKSYINDEYKINVNLVLSAGTKYEDLKDIYSSFSQLGIDTLIFSKLDESRNFGNIFSLIYDYKKPVSYFSVGQGVPNDLMVAGNGYLVDCLLDGFKRPNNG